MSYLFATVETIESIESLHFVTLTSYDQKVSLISLELPESVTIGKKVRLHIKPTNLSLSKELCPNLTIANQLPVRVETIQVGKILSNIKCKFHDLCLDSIITTHQLEKLHIKEGDNIYAFINESALSISLLEQ